MESGVLSLPAAMWRGVSPYCARDRDAKRQSAGAKRRGGWLGTYLVGLVHVGSAAQEQFADGRVAVACSRLVQWRPSHVVGNVHVVAQPPQ